MKTYKVGQDSYVYICTVHTDMGALLNEIEVVARDIVSKCQLLRRLRDVACEMGQNMETAIIDRRDKIEGLEEKVTTMKAKLVKARAKKEGK